MWLCYDKKNHTARQEESHSENQHLWHSSASSLISSRLGKPNCWSSLSKTRNSDMYVFVNQFCNKDAGGRQGGFLLLLFLIGKHIFRGTPISTLFLKWRFRDGVVHVAQQHCQNLICGEQNEYGNLSAI